jgi:hypothetical protein
VIRVHSARLLDVCLQLSSLIGATSAGLRVLVSSFGGGSGVVLTSASAQDFPCPCSRIPRKRAAHSDAPLSSVANRSFTPSMMTVAKHANVAAALTRIADAQRRPWLFLAAAPTACPELVTIYDATRRRARSRCSSRGRQCGALPSLRGAHLSSRARARGAGPAPSRDLPGSLRQRFAVSRCLRCRSGGTSS